MEPSSSSASSRAMRSAPTRGPSPRLSESAALSNCGETTAPRYVGGLHNEPSSESALVTRPGSSLGSTGGAQRLGDLGVGAAEHQDAGQGQRRGDQGPAEESGG